MIKQDNDFDIIEQLKDIPINCSIVFNEENEKNNNNAMNETIIDNLIKKSIINEPNVTQNYNPSLIISPEEMASIIKNLNNNNFIKKSINDNYIKPRKIKNISEKEFDKYLKKFNINKINSLTEKILKDQFNTTLYSKQNSIGPCIGIIHLIESSFGFDKKKLKLMIEKYKNLKNYNYFRSVKGDGNCYYRGFIYKYIETIILNNDVELFKDLILSFEDCFNDEITKKYLKIGFNNVIIPNEIKNILVTIYYSLYKKNIQKSLRILNLAFNKRKNFDNGLILFFRYELYKYINENKFKLYNETFPVLIGNLLPAEFETNNGKFLYEKFYEKYLLKLFTFAEKIVIYLTPFIFPIKLNIILYNASTNDFIQEFYCKSYNKNNYIITLINKTMHYEVIYEINEYLKFEQYLINYTNYNIESVILSNYINKQFETQKNIINNNFNKDSNKGNDKKNYNTLNTQKKNIVLNNKVNPYPVYIESDNQLKRENNNGTFEKPLQVYNISNTNNQNNGPISEKITNSQNQFQNNYYKTEYNSSQYKNFKNNYPIYDNTENNIKVNNNINDKNVNIINNNNKFIQNDIHINNNNNINKNNNIINNGNINLNKNNNIINNEDKTPYNEENIFEHNNIKEPNKKKNNNNNNLINNNNIDYKLNNNKNSIEELNKKNKDINKLEDNDLNENSYNPFKDPLTAHLYFISNKNTNEENQIENFNINQSYKMKKKDDKNKFQNKRLTDNEIEEEIISLINSINETKHEENNNNIVSINQYPNYNKFLINENKTRNNQKCVKCLKSDIKFFNNKLEICEKCFSNLLLEEIQNHFTNYLKKIKKNIKKCKNYSERNNLIINLYCDYMNKFTISKVNISLNEISKNKFPFEFFLQYAKLKICIYCMKKMNSKNFLIIIPCKCVFCSEKCLYKFFDEFNLFSNDTLEYYCLCMYNYLPNDLYKLGEICLFNNIKKFNLNKLIFLFNKMIENICILCKKHFEKGKIKQIQYDDPILNGNYIHAIGNYKKLKHYICSQCLNCLKNKNNEVICEYCDRKHININIYK